MGSDISRVRFDPSRDFARVVQQQGRLVLDADFNEQVAILDRRLRALSADVATPEPTVGIAGTAWVPRLTQDAFKVALAGGTLTLGHGRMYVDGLVAENHGLDPAEWEAVLSEQHGSADTPYDKQPYGPAPALPAGGPHLAYLDVWQRELTHLEDPGLVEVAVGVDTTARLQTVWQARVLNDVGAIDCDTLDADIPRWSALIAPSAGRLTTGTVELGDDENPCELPPSGGYRGLENQTYRVEIHGGGPPGTATFKWSRDNASVAMAVVEMVSPTVLRLASLGRDDVLRIADTNWVEILDDLYELDGRPGEIRQVTVDDAERTITFATALPADLQPADAADAAERHFRVRRWDQAGVVKDTAGGTVVDLDAAGATGLITVPAAGATQVVLEHGVQVSFSVVAGGTGAFKSGDHWIFAARVANTSVEQLVNRPPLGIHHHYARLAIVNFGSGSTTDCRTQWPPSGTGDGVSGDDHCCSVTVGDGKVSFGTFSSIQEAVHFVAGMGGGRVCILRGNFPIDEAVIIETSDIIVSGCGLFTRVISTRDQPAFVVRGDRVTIESLAAASKAREGTIRATASNGLTIKDCLVTNSLQLPEFVAGPVPDLKAPNGPAVAMSEFGDRPSTDLTLRDCVLWGLPAVSFQGQRADIRENAMSGGGAWISDGSHDVRIEHNRIWNGEGPGVVLGGLFMDEEPGTEVDGLALLAITDNQISNMSASGITTWGHFREPESIYDDRRTGLGSPITTLTITGNEIGLCAMSENAALFDPEASGGVILRQATGVRVADNLIADNGGDFPACAVFLHGCIGAEVVDNRLRGNAAPVGDLDPDQPPARYQGGLIAPLVTATYDGVGDPGDVRWDFESARREFERQLAGGSYGFALRADGNTIVSPRGQAVLVQAIGAVAVANSMLETHDVALQPPTVIGADLTVSWLGVCIRIINLGMSIEGAGHILEGGSAPALFRGGIPLDGRVLVHGNQIQTQIPDKSPMFRSLGGNRLGAAIGLISNDDVSFQDNQVVLYARPAMG